MAGGEERSLGERVAILETRADDQKSDIVELRTDVAALKRFQAWMVGIGTGVGAMAGLLAQTVKDRLGIG